MKKEPIWYPYSRTKGKIVSAAGRFLGAWDWRRPSVADLTEPIHTSLCPEIDDIRATLTGSASATCPDSTAKKSS